LRELISGQAKIMEGLFRKLVSNDRVLENINNIMDNLFSTIKNQHSFNKIIESQIVQLAAAVPSTDKGKILGQPKDLETANLVDIHNAAYYCIQTINGKVDRLFLVGEEERSRETCHPYRHWTSHFSRSCL
jgi:hypothetical protein